MYLTIAAASSAKLTEKMSRFLAFIEPVQSAQQAKEVVKQYQNRYHDARHVCWAYVIGPNRGEWQLNDNGEPSGTAGKPILGQLNSFGVTNVVAIVVRYFGGIKLGTPGLIAAYKGATRMALQEARIEEKHELVLLKACFAYPAANEVMKVVKAMELKVVQSDFNNTCTLLLEVRRDMAQEAAGRLSKTAQIEEF